MVQRNPFKNIFEAILQTSKSPRLGDFWWCTRLRSRPHRVRAVHSRSSVITGSWPGKPVITSSFGTAIIAEAGWDIQHDPGLNETGRQQAYTAARALSDRGPLPIVVSPLRRTRETAHEFELMWGCSAKVDSRVAEIPSTGMTLTERGEWLNALWPTV